jgi:hypothetical protein
VIFQCPHCPDGTIGLRGGVCAKCGYALTLGNLLKHTWRRMSGFLSEEPVLRQCPRCGQPVPLNTSICPNEDCRAAIPVEQSAAAPQSFCRAFLSSVTPALKRLIQWGYLLVSVLALFALLAITDRQQTERWPLLVGLSMIYLAVLILLAKVVVPVEVIRDVVRRATGPVKLALICNYFAVLLLLLIVLNTWWTRAIILAVLFGVSWMGMWIFRILLSPWPEKKAGPRYHDPAHPQGRRGRYD